MNCKDLICYTKYTKERIANKMASNAGFNSFSHKAPMLSTDMRCYFGCSEGFKKDVDLRLHLKLRHRGENENELRRAYQAAEEEIALVASSASTFQCALCPKRFNNHKTFYDHVVKRTHKMEWLDYKDKYGRCEVESAPFECKICGRVIKYIRDSITKHLRMVHRITWPLYLDRIRKMRDGQRPDQLPDIEFFECKICNASVKYISKANHLKGVHKITESEYLEHFQDELSNNVNNNEIPNRLKEETYPEMETQQQFEQQSSNKTRMPYESKDNKFRQTSNSNSPGSVLSPSLFQQPYGNEENPRDSMRIPSSNSFADITSPKGEEPSFGENGKLYAEDDEYEIDDPGEN